MRINRLIQLALLFFAAACIAPPNSPLESGAVNESRERPLEADALRALLSGVYATAVQFAGVISSHPPSEIFRPDGTYVRIPNRSRVYGTFDVRGDVVCVRGDGIPELCRQVLPHRDGTYTFIDQSSGSRTRVTITPHR